MSRARTPFSLGRLARTQPVARATKKRRKDVTKPLTLRRLSRVGSLHAPPRQLEGRLVLFCFSSSSRFRQMGEHPRTEFSNLVSRCRVGLHPGSVSCGRLLMGSGAPTAALGRPGSSLMGRSSSLARGPGKKNAPAAKKRMSYSAEFKLMVVKEALQRPPDNRIKPTCANFVGIEPCQVRAHAWACCLRRCARRGRRRGRNARRRRPLPLPRSHARALPPQPAAPSAQRPGAWRAGACLPVWSAPGGIARH